MSTPDPTKPPVILPAEVPAEGNPIPIPPPPPQSYPVSSIMHWVFLLLSVFVIIAAFSMSVRNGEQVVVPIIDKPLPGTCTFFKITGVPCPGCGMTRSFISFAHGHWSDAWNYNPAGLLFFAVVVFQIPYRIFQIVRIRRGLGEHHFVSFDKWILLALVVLLILQWLVRVLWQAIT